MTLAFVVLFVGALGVLAWGAPRVLTPFLGELRAIRGELSRIGEGPEAAFSQRLLEMEHTLELLPQRWEEFKNEARRAEGRARSIVDGARKELEGLGFEHPGLEEQARELRLVDGDPGPGEAVPTVRTEVESAAPEAESWRSLGVRRKFGGQ